MLLFNVTGTSLALRRLFKETRKHSRARVDFELPPFHVTPLQSGVTTCVTTADRSMKMVLLEQF